MTAVAEPPTAASPADTRPEPGELRIAGRRAWKTWQLVVAVVVAALFGMWLNGSTAANTQGGRSAGAGFTLPQPAASSTTQPGAATTAPSTAPGGGTGTTAADATTTTAAGGTATSLPPASVLVPATQLTGDWTSPVFTILGGTWNIGFAYACQSASASPPGFQVFVVAANQVPSASATPAVSGTAAQGQSVQPETSTGSQQIVVEGAAGCRWAVKVTGSGTP